MSEQELSKSHALYQQIKSLVDEFIANHADFHHKGNKAAGGRARKNLGEIKKLVTPYRQASVEESKK